MERKAERAFDSGLIRAHGLTVSSHYVDGAPALLILDEANFKGHTLSDTK